MGLDMYLYRKHYVGNKYRDDAKKVKVMLPEELDSFSKSLKHLDDGRISEITEEVMYWRKANAIHKWFVENVQSGVDDCKEYSVSRGDLLKLRDLCTKVVEGSVLKDGKVVNGYHFEKHTGAKVANLEDGKVIEDASLANELLPTTNGFFFGGTEYDQYYFDDIKRTKEELDTLLAEDESDDFVYQSSW